MNKQIKRIFGTIICLGIVACAVAMWMIYRVKYAPCYSGENRAYLYIDNNDDADSLVQKMKNAGIDTFGWDILCQVSTFKLHTGRYGVSNSDAILGLFRHLRNHQQDPIDLTVPSIRLSIAPQGQPQPMPLDRLATTLARQLMTDSTSIAEQIADMSFYAPYDLDKRTFPTLFIPNTYQVYWDITPSDLLKRLKKEYDSFWNDERKRKAETQGLTPTQTIILASLVEEETSNNTEKPMVAGLYINRLRSGMLLQADPTVKYAVGDWSLRRVLGKHLQEDNPYNTYRYAGLPPGPLRIPSISGIDAVLNAPHHNYIYMCAKEDFSGTHNFAATYQEHQQNARRYVQALNTRGIK